MPETEYEYITKEWLQCELRATSCSPSSSATDAKDLIVLDCRSSNEYSECHIRSAVNFSIPSIMLRRLAAGKIDLLSTIKSPDLKERIQHGYKVNRFILYNDVGVQPPDVGATTTATTATATNTIAPASTLALVGNVATIPSGVAEMLGGVGGGGGGGGVGGGSSGNGGGFAGNNDTTISVLHRRLKQDGCRVVSLKDGFSSFRDSFPEWCEGTALKNHELESSRSAQADQLMGLRSLRISTPHSDSACSSSAESSDCESNTHHNFNEAPVEIVPGLFLGNASHSCDSRALQKYNIKYVLNVTPDLPNVFEDSGRIQYLQIPITDHYSQDLAIHFPAAIKFIEEARSNNSSVLVHCLAGVSRSVTVTLAYLMHTRALCLNDAFTLVRDRKPDVSPNFHFMQQLHSFERQLRLSPRECCAMDSSNSVSVDIGDGSVAVLATATVTLTSNAATAANRCCPVASKFSCNCIANDCKCMQSGGYVTTQLGKPSGVSPDSGIEFDRWTPADAGLK